MRVSLTLKSRNAKTGPIPVSTSSNDTCPAVCPLKDQGCYAKYGPLGMYWAKVNGGTAGATWGEFVAQIAELPDGALWRHNQAGDLPGTSNAIDAPALAKLVKANSGKRGFTYTHKPMTAANARAVRKANAAGFTINLSGNNLAHADALADTGAGPVVVVLPADQKTNTTTPAGRKVIVCPATIRDDVSCATCQLCQRRDRTIIVGFPAHGAAKRMAETRTSAAA